MTLLDQFESRFERATKARYVHSSVEVRKVLFLTDQPAAETERLCERARRLLRAIDAGATEPVEWVCVDGDQYRTGPELLTRIDAVGPDLLVTYRALKEEQRDLIYSLGTYLDVLTQTLTIPVLVLPVERDLSDAQVEEGTPQVMAITDHLTGDARLVDWSVRFVLGTPGDLFLVHVEDAHTFARYMEVIRKLPELDTEVAHEAILKQLLKEPEDYIETVRAELTRGAAPVSVHPVVKLGHRVTEYTALIDQNQVDLLVFVSEDAHQVAMHGIAYSLAVELKHLPLLLL